MNERGRSDASDNPAFVAGIHHYCDRWCERCEMTSRCRVFADEQAGRAPPQPREITDNHETFWRKLEDSLRATNELLRALRNAQGIAPSPEERSPVSRDERQNERAGENTTLIQPATEYARRVNRWFEEQKALLFAKEEEVAAQARLGVAGVKEEVTSLTDVVEIIRWYQHQIYVKLAQAVEQQHCDAGASSENVGDEDGYAKVALIGIDRSIAAWIRMRDHFPEKSDDLLNFLVDLDRLRRAVEGQFPKARRFVRPGFDTPVS